MDNLPALLAAMYRAPLCATLRGSFTYWRDHAAWRAALDELPGLSIGGEVASHDSLAEVWFDAHGRLRVDQDGNIVVTEPDTVTRYYPGHGGIRSARPQRQSFDWPELVWRPRPLLTALDIEAVNETHWLGRRAWTVTAARSALEFMPPIDVMLGGRYYKLVIDQETGIAVRITGALTDGTRVFEIAWTTFEPDAPVGPGVFEVELPPGERVQTAGEMRLAALVSEGIDVSGVDPEDESAVTALFQQLHSRRRGAPLQQYVPKGSPPADEETARAAIETAYRNIGDRDGARLLHVQAGDGLAPCLDRARQRFSADLQVQTIKFLNASEAAVLFSAVMPDGRMVLREQTGRVLIEDGTWKLERSGFTSLLSLAGVQCPPPPD